MIRSKDEYLILREEILHLDTVVNNTINLLYTVVASLLAFALTQEDTIFILLSYVVIVPSYLLVISKIKGMAKIGAYLYVFHEGKKFNWETRNIEFMENVSLRISSTHFPFIFVNIAIILLFLAKTTWKCPLPFYDSFKLVLGILLFTLMLYLINKSKHIHTQKYVERWQIIKQRESK